MIAVEMPILSPRAPAELAAPASHVPQRAAAQGRTAMTHRRVPSPVTPSTARPNTTGLSGAALTQVLDRLDEGPDHADAGKRRFARWPYRRVSLPLRVTHPMGDEIDMNVAARNISSEGMSFLHNAYMHPGSRCRLRLPRPLQNDLLVEAKVVRCVHRAGMIHEVGLRFVKPLKLAEVLPADPLSNRFTLETIAPDMLEGTVLHISPSEENHAKLRGILGETRLAVRDVMTLTAPGPERAPDAILCDLRLPGLTPRQTYEKIRELGHTAPVIAIAGSAAQLTAEVAKEVPAAAFLVRPLEERLVLRALAEVLLVTPHTS